MWQSFVQWFASVIEFMYGITGSLGVPNYGLAIIFLTIVIKIILFPLTQKQMKSMRGMQEIQPKMKRIQEKYKDNPQKAQEKVMELYKDNGVSPFGGCLPLLIQMPIFIAFYQSLFKFDFAVAEHASFLWIPDIAQPDKLFILAILAAGTTFLQQRISMVDTKDQTQRTMLYIMPLFMAWIAATMPAGLPLYWVTFNILGIIQQLFVNKASSRAKLDTGTGVQVEVEMESESAAKTTSKDTTKKDTKDTKNTSKKTTKKDSKDTKNTTKKDPKKDTKDTKNTSKKDTKKPNTTGRGKEGGKKNATPDNRKKGKKR
ncbi:MAG TPA: YidC/Oxa1 family membrane protein insertase [Syntrophomonadaceae bacterium]|nr:YidC/Oxa1 family membrane protein insertase [Syntrophomonadaceae bacterium]